MASNILIKVEVCQSLNQDRLSLVICLLFVLVQCAARKTLELIMVLHRHVKECLSPLLLKIRVLRMMAIRSLALFFHRLLRLIKIFHRRLLDYNLRLLLSRSWRALHGRGAFRGRGSIRYLAIRRVWKLLLNVRRGICLSRDVDTFSKGLSLLSRLNLQEELAWLLSTANWNALIRILLYGHCVAPLERADYVLGRGWDGHPVALWTQNVLIRVPLVLRRQQNTRMHCVLTELSIDLQHGGAYWRDIWTRGRPRLWHAFWQILTGLTVWEDYQSMHL